MQVIRTMENDAAKIEVLADGSVRYTYATPGGVVVASSWVDIPDEDEAPFREVIDASGFEDFPVFVAGEYVMDGLRQA